MQYQCSGQHMFIVDKYYRQFLRDSLRPYQLTAAQGMVLLVLHQPHSGAGFTHEEINESLQYDKAALTRALKELEEKQLVQRRAHARDKRSFYFTATPKGSEMLPILVGILQRWETEIFTGFTQEEKNQFLQAIQRVADSAKTAACNRRAEEQETWTKKESTP